ncbi:metal ABC transporter permease [Facklamia sp. P12955]|uniref:metal ABC transporter permease n=1 Tax=Facklamia sp. P12955 TaxID=3421946 RepID=UPI003D179589
MDILTSYSFILIALSTFLLASASGAVGAVSVFKSQSLIGDAIGHATYPGIVLAFMLTLSKDTMTMMIGAVISGGVAYGLIQIIDQHSKLNLDAILAIILSSFFGFGMVLKSNISGNPRFKGASQSGLKNYLFGQASYIMENDLKIILIVALISIFILILFKKEIKLFVFDEVYAKTVGIKPVILYSIILVMTMSLIAVGLKLVGTILIASILIVPSIAAMQWTHRFERVLILSGIFGGISAVIGTYISTKYNGMSTGPTIILTLSIVALLSMLFGKKGIVQKTLMPKKGGEFND